MWMWLAEPQTTETIHVLQVVFLFAGSSSALIPLPFPSEAFQPPSQNQGELQWKFLAISILNQASMSSNLHLKYAFHGTLYLAGPQVNHQQALPHSF